MKQRPTFPARMDSSVSAAKAKPLPSVNLPQGLGMDSMAVRQRMVQKLAAQGLSDPRVLAAMAIGVITQTAQNKVYGRLGSDPLSAHAGLMTAGVQALLFAR